MTAPTSLPYICVPIMHWGQDGIYLRVTLKALGHAVHLAFDLGAGIVVLPAAKLPALAL